MNLSSLRERVANATGLSTSDASSLTKIDAWINQAYQHVSGLYGWPWLVKQGTLVTSADITTGTVSITAGDTALTFSSAPAASVAGNWMIQFTSVSDDWYDIATHTAASTSAVLASTFNGTSNLSGASYILRKVYYSLPSDLDRIISIRQMRTDFSLIPVDIRYLDKALPDPDVTGIPTNYALFGLDSSNYWKMTVYPTPNAAMNLLVRYYKKITELSATTDEPILPTKFHNAIVHCALYLYGYQYIDDTRQQESKKAFEQLIEDMKQNSSVVPGAVATPIPWDQRPSRSHIGLQLPEHIGD